MAHADDAEHDSWYRYGQAVLYLEMLVAILMTVFALYLAFNGETTFLA